MTKEKMMVQIEDKELRILVNLAQEILEERENSQTLWTAEWLEEQERNVAVTEKYDEILLAKGV